MNARGVVRPEVCARFLPVDRALDGPWGTGLLNDGEQARNRSLVHADDRAAHLAAHLLVRGCVAELVGIGLAQVQIAQRCPTCGSDRHGPPYVVDLPDVHVSLSHTRGFVAAVAAGVPCGIDVEVVPTSWPGSALGRTETEWIATQEDPAQAFTRLWVRKEALVKAGHGTLAEMGGTCLVGPGGPLSTVAGHRVEETALEGAVGAVCLWRGTRRDII